MGRGERWRMVPQGDGSREDEGEAGSRGRAHKLKNGPNIWESNGSQVGEEKQSHCDGKKPCSI